MRGAPAVVGLDDADRGIIPAYAGSTPSGGRLSCRSRDHPRVCGEHIDGNTSDGYHTGSSPRMRGALFVAVVDHEEFGIIPAYAGSTSPPPLRSCGSRDHPRVCGEHFQSSSSTFSAAGSSPRMRGALLHAVRAQLEPGIIPAYAGSTKNAVCVHFPVRDHPRVCGEHASSNLSATKGAGSSPRMRGALDKANFLADRTGIIPAYAGSTDLFGKRQWRVKDHPRVCGEHCLVVWLEIPQAGSSPRMRGALDLDYYYHHWGGIIPAYAGSTSMAIPIGRLLWDHPRVCGEHEGMATIRVPDMGSSPRMRGALSDTLGPSVRTGIIPAYAGSTRQFAHLRQGA